MFKIQNSKNNKSDFGFLVLGLFRISDLEFSISKSGFTLLEMLISLGIFSVVVVSSIGLTINISNAQRKASNIQAIQDNIRFGLELMTKEMRTGSNFRITSLCSPTAEIMFEDANFVEKVYFLSGNTVMRLVKTSGAEGCAEAVPFTADDVRVDALRFFLRGHAVSPNDGQPMITISISVRSKSEKIALESSMNLQTTIVQRLRDL